MYREVGEGGNLSDSDAEGVGFFLKEPDDEEGVRLFLTLQRLLAQDERTRSAEKLHDGRFVLKYWIGKN